jgi:hypothetical protein
LLARLARPAARAGRAAALAATLAATRIGLLRVAVAPLGPRDRDDLLDLVFAAGVDLGLPGDPAGPEPPAAALRNGEILGARISGVLAAAAGPGRALGRPDAARPVLAVHPLARGSVERALVDACRARGLPPPAPLRPLAPWHRAACRWVGAEVADE